MARRKSRVMLKWEIEETEAKLAELRKDLATVTWPAPVPGQVWEIAGDVYLVYKTERAYASDAVALVSLSDGMISPFDIRKYVESKSGRYLGMFNEVFERA